MLVQYLHHQRKLLFLLPLQRRCKLLRVGQLAAQKSLACTSSYLEPRSKLPPERKFYEVFSGKMRRQFKSHLVQRVLKSSSNDLVTTAPPRHRRSSRSSFDGPGEGKWPQQKATTLAKSTHLLLFLMESEKKRIQWTSPGGRKAATLKGRARGWTARDPLPRTSLVR